MDKYKKLMVITVALQVISLVLWFVPMFSVSQILERLGVDGADRYRVGGQTTASFAECFEGVMWIFVLVVILWLAATAYIGLLLKKGDFSKPRKFVLPKISVFLTLAIWLIPFTGVLDTAKEYAQYGASGGLTFGGWLFVVVMVALTGMLFLLSYLSKTICEQQEKEQFIADAYARKENGVETIPAGGWRCICGKAHAPYVSSCSCGTNKNQVCQQKE